MNTPSTTDAQYLLPYRPATVAVIAFSPSPALAEGTMAALSSSAAHTTSVTLAGLDARPPSAAECDSSDAERTPTWMRHVLTGLWTCVDWPRFLRGRAVRSETPPPAGTAQSLVCWRLCSTPGATT